MKQAANFFSPLACKASFIHMRAIEKKYSGSKGNQTEQTEKLNRIFRSVLENVEPKIIGTEPGNENCYRIKKQTCSELESSKLINLSVLFTLHALKYKNKRRLRQISVTRFKRYTAYFIRTLTARIIKLTKAAHSSCI